MTEEEVQNERNRRKRHRDCFTDEDKEKERERKRIAWRNIPDDERQLIIARKSNKGIAKTLNIKTKPETKPL